MTKILLPHVNLWLALAFESHGHHAQAKTWFDAVQPDEMCAFCRMTQQGFLRLATNPQAFQNEAVTLERAWQLFDAFMSDANVVLLEEPAGIETPWRKFTVRRTFSPKVWNDAYLAAFAMQVGGTVVTFDKSMTQYASVACTILA
jgi:toxin-antitoxin system PIN domain toxin